MKGEELTWGTQTAVGSFPHLPCLWQSDCKFLHSRANRGTMLEFSDIKLIHEWITRDATLEMFVAKTRFILMNGSLNILSNLLNSHYILYQYNNELYCTPWYSYKLKNKGTWHCFVKWVIICLNVQDIHITLLSEIRINTIQHLVPLPQPDHENSPGGTCT